MPFPMSRFGDVPFLILRLPGEQTPEWSLEHKSKTFHFPGGNKTFTQILGQGDWTVEYLVKLDSHADFGRLMALVNTRQVLRVPFGVTVYPGTREFQEHGELYKEFDRIFLPKVTDIRGRNDASVTVTVSLSREVPS